MITIVIVTILGGLVTKSRAIGVLAGFVVGFFLAGILLPGIVQIQMNTTVTEIRLSPLSDGSYVRAEPIKNGVEYNYLPKGADGEKSLVKSPRVKFNWTTAPNSIPVMYRTDHKASNGLVWLFAFPNEDSDFVFMVSKDSVNYDKITPGK